MRVNTMSRYINSLPQRYTSITLTPSLLFEWLSYYILAQALSTGPKERLPIVFPWSSPTHILTGLKALMMNFLAAYTLPGTSLGNKVHRLQKLLARKGSLYKLVDSKHLPFSTAFLKANQRVCGGNAHDSRGGAGGDCTHLDSSTSTVGL